MARINTNIRPAKNSVHPGLVSGDYPCELSLEGELTGQGKLWLSASSGTPATWTSLDRVVCLGKHAPVTLVSSFDNSWDNYGSSYLEAGYYKDSAGVLWLQGAIQGGTLGMGAFQLPAGYYDSTYRYMFPVFCTNGSAQNIGVLDILQSGQVRPNSGSTTRFCLDGVKLPLAGSWMNASLGTGWANYGGVFAPAGYSQDGDGVVYLRGVVYCTTGSGAGSTIFTLPAGYRPSHQLIFAVKSYDTSTLLDGRLDILADGSVLFQSSDASGWCTLDVIAFPCSTITFRKAALLNEWQRYSLTFADAEYVRIRDVTFIRGLLKSGPLSAGYMIRVPEAPDYASVESLDDKPVRATDFLEAMEFGNYIRQSNRALSAVSWTDTPAGDVKLIRKAHMDDLRLLAAGNVNYGGSDFSFTDPVITAGTTQIRAVHLEEVRQSEDDAGFFARCHDCHSYCGQSCSAQCAVSCSVSCNITCSGYCQSGCGNTCYDSCSLACHTSCSGTCYTSCSGTCTRSNCAADSCGPSCSHSCHGSCNWTCVGGFFVPHGFCSGDCWGECTDNCYGGCSGSCGAGSCSGLCNASCATNCYSACSGCADTCTLTCTSSCSLHCYTTCDTECGSNCTDACYLDCSTECIGNCYNSCLAGCFSSCADTARHGTDPGGF